MADEPKTTSEAVIASAKDDSSALSMAAKTEAPAKAAAPAGDTASLVARIEALEAQIAHWIAHFGWPVKGQ